MNRNVHVDAGGKSFELATGQSRVWYHYRMVDGNRKGIGRGPFSTVEACFSSVMQEVGESIKKDPLLAMLENLENRVAELERQRYALEGEK